MIPAGNPSLWTGPTGTNTYLLTGRTPALIDAGIGKAAHLDSVAAGLGRDALQLVLLTHSHSDHASGVPAVLERWPGAHVRPAMTPLSDGDSIEAGDRRLTALYTPGHAPDHFCFVDEERREAFCGDLVRTGGTVVIPASKGGDLRAYLHSLRRLRESGAVRLWPGHGPAIDNPERLIDEYISHRADRDAQIVEALRRGHGTPAEIATEVYGRIPSALVAASADSVLAHLIKLQGDGLAVLDGERWHLVP